jgi:ribosome-binding factor A
MQPNPFKEQKIEEHLKHLAAEFIQRESNGTSLITVTSVHMSDRLTRAHIFFTVLPDNKQEQVLDFLNRNRSEFREHIKKHSRLGRLPSVTFALDFGEKNRQRIEEISQTPDVQADIQRVEETVVDTDPAEDGTGTEESTGSVETAQ